jgi:hypothetical protein
LARLDPVSARRASGLGFVAQPSNPTVLWWTVENPTCRLWSCAATLHRLRSTTSSCFFCHHAARTSGNVNIYDDFLVTLHLFVMEVVSTVTNFVTSSQITNDDAKPLKVMTKLRGSSPNNELFRHRWIISVLPVRNQQTDVTEKQHYRQKTTWKKDLKKRKEGSGPTIVPPSHGRTSSWSHSTCGPTSAWSHVWAPLAGPFAHPPGITRQHGPHQHWVPRVGPTNA